MAKRKRRTQHPQPSLREMVDDPTLWKLGEMPSPKGTGIFTKAGEMGGKTLRGSREFGRLLEQARGPQMLPQPEAAQTGGIMEALAKALAMLKR